METNINKYLPLSKLYFMHQSSKIELNVNPIQFTIDK